MHFHRYDLDCVLLTRADERRCIWKTDVFSNSSTWIIAYDDVHRDESNKKERKIMGVRARPSCRTQSGFLHQQND